MRHEVTRKKNTKVLNHPGNLFRNNVDDDYWIQCSVKVEVLFNFSHPQMSQLRTTLYSIIIISMLEVDVLSFIFVKNYQGIKQNYER